MVTYSMQLFGCRVVCLYWYVLAWLEMVSLMYYLMLQVENNAMEDIPALSLFSLDYSEEGKDEDEEMLE
jgi:hypothetical protein